MTIEKLTKRLQGSIDFALDNEEDLDAASWSYQEGILITVNEAKLLLDIVKNCSIADVSFSLRDKFATAVNELKLDKRVKWKVWNNELCRYTKKSICPEYVVKNGTPVQINCR
jgi:hypothetical protein